MFSLQLRCFFSFHNATSNGPFNPNMDVQQCKRSNVQVCLDVHPPALRKVPIPHDTAQNTKGMSIPCPKIVTPYPYQAAQTQQPKIWIECTIQKDMNRKIPHGDQSTYCIMLRPIQITQYTRSNKSCFAQIPMFKSKNRSNELMRFWISLRTWFKSCVGCKGSVHARPSRQVSLTLKRFHGMVFCDVFCD